MEPQNEIRAATGPGSTCLLFSLPIELFRLIIETTIEQNGLPQAIWARLVCKLEVFDEEIIRAICTLNALGPSCNGYPRGKRIWTEYLKAQVRSRSPPSCHLVKVIRYCLESIMEHVPFTKDVSREYLDVLCSRVVFARETAPVWMFRSRSSDKYPLSKSSLHGSLISATALLGLNEFLKTLVETGYDDEDTFFGWPIECAAHRGDIPSVKLLYSKWSSTHSGNYPDEHYLGRALCSAAGSGSVATIRFLCSPDYADNISAHYYEVAVMNAAAHGKSKAMLFLIRSADTFGHIPKMKFLPLLSRRGNKSPPLWDCILLKAASGGYEDIVSLALQKGASVNAGFRGSLGCHTLVGAARNGHEKIVRQLLLKGADPNILARANILSKAAYGGWIGISRVLIEHGASPRRRRGCLWSTTPLSIAVSRGHHQLAQILLDCGAEPAVSSNSVALATSYGHASTLEELNIRIEGP
ncbi:ankyrin repeat-containing domain protein [Clohesyomyces aquaticus]|uniref:Ankyrin repeat-containing domain protein n=1 Tax=Clohesyomyces aquaticus TaxID=1231657 RepID=A0A1Y1ZX96_9PLEO|nr:ankyrin repeat-containing domain protein [Clohesyomyces aquaticus]